MPTVADMKQESELAAFRAGASWAVDDIKNLDKEVGRLRAALSAIEIITWREQGAGTIVKEQQRAITDIRKIASDCA